MNRKHYYQYRLYDTSDGRGYVWSKPILAETKREADKVARKLYGGDFLMGGERVGEGKAFRKVNA